MTAQVLPDWLKVKSYIQSIVGLVTHVTVGNALISFVVLSLGMALIVDDVTVIEPIAVPKALADAGYTPEVAGHRLLDALQQLVKAEPERHRGRDVLTEANSILAHNVAARDELPDFVVPQIGLSLSSIVSSIRSVLNYGKGGKAISGELIVRDKDKYALRVRVNGGEVFNSGFDSDNPDDLFDQAARAILETLWPALGANMLYRTSPDQALEHAENIIATFEESDPNVLVAYILKGEYWYEHKCSGEADKMFSKGEAETMLPLGDDLNQEACYGEAEKMFRRAINLSVNTSSLHNRLSLTLLHNRLGLALLRQGNFPDALKEFSLNPRSAETYNNIGAARFAAQVRIHNTGGKLNEAELDEARKNYERAIALRPHDAGVHNNLGLLWQLRDNREDAMTEFRQAIESDRNYLYGHWNLAATLVQLNRFDDALAEYRIALDCTQVPRELALLHIHTGNALKAKAGAGGNLDEAIAEYRRAVEIDRSYAWTHNSLAEVLRDQGKIDEAVTQYHAALQSSHTDDEIKAAKEGLEAIQANKEPLQAKEKVKEKAKPVGAYKEQVLPASVRDAQAEMK